MPLWTPADLAVLPAVWFSAQRSTVTQSGGSVSAIQNLGSLGGSLTESYVPNEPIYSASGWDGSRPSIMFTHSTLYLPWAYSGNRLAIFGATETSAGDGGRIVNLRTDNFEGYADITVTQVARRNSTQFQSARDYVDTPFNVGDAKHIFGAVHGASGASLRADGGTAVTNSQVGSFGFTQLFIGAEFGGEYGTNYVTAKIPEVIVLSYEPTSGEREQIEGYLAWEWGVQALLPSGHPYRNAAPQTGSTDITGVMAASESGADVLSASGTASISGSMSAIEAGADVASASGTVSVRGTLSSTETGSDGFGSSGSVAVSGAILATETGADSFAASGTVTAAGPTGAMNAVESGSDAFSAIGTVSGNVEPTPSYQAYYGGNGFSPKPKKGEIEKLERLLFPKKRKPKPVVVKAVVTALKEAAPDVSPSILLDIVSKVVEVAPLNESKGESRIATEAMVLRVLELQEEEDIEALLLMS